MIGNSDLLSKPDYGTLKKSPSSKNDRAISQKQEKISTPCSLGGSPNSPWPTQNARLPSLEARHKQLGNAANTHPTTIQRKAPEDDKPSAADTALSADTDVAKGGWASIKSLNSQAAQNTGATAIGPPAGYYQGPSGKWFRPDGKFASNVEVGLPAPVKPQSGGGGGRLGNSATRLQNSQIADYIVTQGGTITGGGGRFPEEYLPGPGGGTKGSNYLDITAEIDGKTVRINTVDVNADGTLTGRESRAANSILSKTGEEIITVPKGSGLGDLPDKINSSATADAIQNSARTAGTAVDAVQSSARTAGTAVDAVQSSVHGAKPILRGAGKVLGVAGAAMDVNELYDSYQADGGEVGENTVTSAGGIAGSWGGSILGAAAAGAALGSIVPGAGTAAGFIVGLAGGIVGGLFGRWAGEKAGETAWDIWGDD